LKISHFQVSEASAYFATSILIAHVYTYAKSLNTFGTTKGNQQSSCSWKFNIGTLN